MCYAICTGHGYVNTIFGSPSWFRHPAVHFESQMADDIAAVWQSGCFQLQQLGSIRQSLTLVAGNMLVHVFISSRLDYCNQRVVSVSGRLLDKLQSLQNAAARLVTELKPGKLTTWRLWCERFTGNKFGIGYGSGQPFWCISVYMD